MMDNILKNSKPLKFICIPDMLNFDREVYYFKQNKMLVHIVLLHCPLMSTLYVYSSFDVRGRTGNSAIEFILICSAGGAL